MEEVITFRTEGMDVVKKIESLGSGSGKPSQKVQIEKSGTGTLQCRCLPESNADSRTV